MSLYFARAHRINRYVEADSIEDAAIAFRHWWASDGGLSDVSIGSISLVTDDDVIRAPEESGS